MAYRDGELPPERAAVVQSHLAGCATCQSIGRDLERISGTLGAWTIDEAPATLRLENRANQAAAPKPFGTKWLPSWAFYSLSGAALAAATLVLVVLPQQARDSMQSRMNVGRTAVPARAEVRELETRTGSVSPGPVATVLEAPGIQGGAGQQAAPVRALSTARIVRTATLLLVAADFDAARIALTRIVAEMNGFVGNLDVSGVPPNPRVLTATIRIPSARLDAALGSMKALGKVLNESQSADDVTEQALDLEARIANGRNTEKRLNDLLQKRTGDLSDVLAAERELSRVREEIERLDAQRQNLEKRVTYSTVSLRIEEPQKSTMNLGPLPLSGRFRNALVDGFKSVFVSVVEIAIVSLQVAPTLIFWGMVILGPVYLFKRRTSRAAARRGEA